MSVNLLNAYTANANFDIELYFTALFNKIPSKYEFEIHVEELQLDSNTITFDYIKDLFPGEVQVRIYKTESIEKEDLKETDDIEHFNFNEGYDSAMALCIATENKIISINYKTIRICYDAKIDSIESIKELASNCMSRFPKAKPEDKHARVGLIKVSNGDYYSVFSEIRTTNIDIEENYNDDFIPVYKDIVDFLNQRESGLILLYGTMGSGKSTIIRHLCSNIPKDYVIVPNSIAPRLGDPDFISYVTDCKNYVFILEDCEQLLVDRVNNPWNNAITTILNMADGLLSDIVNIKFICTFNAKVDKIDKALLRKGRCFAKYEFKELCEEKVAKLNEKYNLGLSEIKPMTLAEIYNSEKTDYSDKEKEMGKIGF